MNEYFMLNCWGLDNDEPTQKPLDANFEDYDEDNEIDWFIGQKINIELPQPIMMEWNPELSGGGMAWQMFGQQSVGPRNESGIRRQWAYPAEHPPLFHRDLVEALRECGVDNFDAYQTNIVDKESGTVCADYLAVNFIGLIKAVNMEKSVAVQHTEDGLVDTDFDSVVLSEPAAYGLKLFRLAENISALVVHRTVKEHLISKGGFELTFTSPEDWIG